ncbi:MAG: hypothetical protein ABS56_05445 [Lautropia sp. SCN 69-89]|nr:MAG: hypothetical protein ABS56_05445 [Lautropia sp. SCN 69-89]
MRIRNQRDFWSGVMFLVLGVLFVIFSQAYQLGTPARMGPGFFPTMLGALMALLGLGIGWRALSRSSGKVELEPVGWRELFLILLAVGVFAAALSQLGMVVAITLLIAISALASHEFNWKETAISIVVLLVLSDLVFVRGLELQFPVWPVFLTR